MTDVFPTFARSSRSPVRSQTSSGASAKRAHSHELRASWGRA